MKSYALNLNIIILFALNLLSHLSYSQSPNPSFNHAGGDFSYKGNYALVFHDEFDGTSLDTKKWITWFPDRCGDSVPDAWNRPDTFARLSSQENGLQIYRDENVVVKDGNCSLIAKKETSTWAGVTKN